MITIEETKSVEDLKAVLELQKANKNKLSRTYSLELLSRLNDAVPIVVAKDGQKIVGYCVAMLRQYTMEVPELADHFNQVDSLIYSDKPLIEYPYVMEDQVCVDIDYRKQGIPGQMYRRFALRFKDQFLLMVTGIRETNIASLDSHRSAKFVEIKEIPGSSPETEGNWVILVSEWQMI